MNKMVIQSFDPWQLIKCLGEGAFGEVHHWKNRLNGQEIATKHLKSNPKLKPDEIDILCRRWIQEYKWMQTLKTSYIVGAAKINDTEFFNYLAERNNFKTSLPVIIMEYCNGGDLREHLNKIENCNGLCETEVRNILRTLRHGIEYLHQECNIEHRDIKPENIVIHRQRDKKLYKITDFGYARDIPDSTIAQSVVGTRNYVAPEVIDPGCYTKTIDYWSIGNVAFEIICGVQPFIPHQTIVQRITNIKLKPADCIAIVQKIDKVDNVDQYQFLNKIFGQNHSSSIFIEGMEKWLRLSLDNNYKTRGLDANGQLKFYSDLDAVLQQKIVTVYSLKTFKKYYYDIETFKDVEEFVKKLSLDNKIHVHNLFFIFPTSHPKKSFLKPIDYYVPEWCDITESGNPPVMLFVAEYMSQCDYNVKIDEQLILSDAIELCMSSNGANIPLWLLQQFEKDVHFSLSNAHHLLECYLIGLHEYVMRIEHEVFLYEREIVLLNDKTLMLSGFAKSFNTSVNEIMKFQQGEFLKTAVIKANDFSAKCQEMAIKVVPAIKNMYRSILRVCKELAQNEFYQELAKSDIFKLSHYREFLSHVHTTAERILEGQSSFERCLLEFNKFNKNISMKEICRTLHQQLKEFHILREVVKQKFQFVSQIETELEGEQRRLLRHAVSNNDSLSMDMQSLHIDGALPSILAGSFSSNENDTVFDPQAILEMDEALKIVNAMKSIMDVDEDLPTNNNEFMS